MKLMSTLWKKHLQLGEELVLEFGVGVRYLRLMLISGILTLPIIFGFFILGRYFYLKYGRKYLFTNRRMLSMEGWFTTDLISIDYNQVTDLKVRENFVDKFFTSTGTIIINTAGSTKDEVTITNVSDPRGKLNLLYQLIEKNEELTGARENFHPVGAGIAL